MTTAKKTEKAEITTNWGSGRWLIISNPLPNSITIAPDSRSDDGGRTDLHIVGYDHAAIRGTAWDDDYNLEQAAERGRIVVYRSNTRPRKLPGRPDDCDMRHPLYNGMLHEMVFGDRENAEGFINSEPRLLDRAGMPIDRDWLKTTGWNILNAAYKWLKAWGPPEDHTWKLEAIESRLEDIKLMP